MVGIPTTGVHRTASAFLRSEVADDDDAGAAVAAGVLYGCISVVPVTATSTTCVSSSSIG
jgi:hypothetical protein